MTTLTPEGSFVRRGRRASVRWHRRTLAWATGLGLAVALIGYAGIGISEFPLSPVDVGRILLGGGTKPENYVVFDVQVPRVLLAALAGFGLAMSGALTRTVARNPLATPDLIGITSGATVFAVLAIGFRDTWGSALASIGTVSSALLGAALTGSAVFALAARRGFDPFRLVLTGVAFTWFCQALVTYLLTRADIYDVATAQRWMVGSVANATMDRVIPVAVLVPLAVVACMLLARHLRVYPLGDDSAASLGTQPNRTAAITFALAVVVAAVCTAVAGPIAFVALLAPQVAVMVTRSPTPIPCTAGWVGALLVVAGDLLTRTLLPPGLAVGIVTAAIGGPALVALLLVRIRR
ncbi:FecCD family ABC transporter permease [Millisia brevis]|uniref:FecCD family ABC transporter permease n=1 Tax=Millisia brevis TaxID=264148 RepID=UPI000A075C5A|nr:iron ABC transporter permease [Millisia brevis]